MSSGPGSALLHLHLPSTELHPYCWAVFPQGCGHLGSSCLLTLFSVNCLQEGCFSATEFCSCFALHRGVFGKQGYQCQGKVLCSGTVCVQGVLSQEHFPVLLGCPVVTGFSEVTAYLPPQPAKTVH